MVNFRMKLYGVGILSTKAESGIFNIRSESQENIVFRQDINALPVRPPYGRRSRNLPEQRRVRFQNLQHGPSVFPRKGGMDRPAVSGGKVLSPKTDSQQRDLPLYS